MSQCLTKILNYKFVISFLLLTWISTNLINMVYKKFKKIEFGNLKTYLTENEVFHTGKFYKIL